jgi:hypothetical protein
MATSAMEILPVRLLTAVFTWLFRLLSWAVLFAERLAEDPDPGLAGTDDAGTAGVAGPEHTGAAGRALGDTGDSVPGPARSHSARSPHDSR